MRFLMDEVGGGRIQETREQGKEKDEGQVLKLFI